MVYTKSDVKVLRYAGAKKVCANTGYVPKGSASELLSLTPVLEKFLVDVVLPVGVLADVVGSMLLLIKVTSLLQQVQRGTVVPGTLHTCICAHLEKHLSVWGESLWKPKMHYALHLGHQLLRHGTLMATFVLERKHRVLKRFANPRHKTMAFERALLEEVTQQHLYVLQEPLSGVLCTPIAASRKLLKAVQSHLHQDICADDVKSSRAVVVKSRKICKGDVVAFVRSGSMHFAEVYFFVQVRAHFLACLSAWPLVESSGSSVRCRVVDNPEMVALDTLLESCVFSPTKVGRVCNILVPDGLRV